MNNQSGSEQTCPFAIFHGPGHQSRTTCQALGKHEFHHAIYGEERQYAVWHGDRDAMSGFFDEPPPIEKEDDGN